MLDKIRVVLVETSHPGNIGAVSRAMKTMGLSKLYLVDPQLFPHPKAIEMASGATDILDSAVITCNLDDAIADCQLIVGTSARMRAIPWPLLNPKELVDRISKEPDISKIALLFGPEQSGLTNADLEKCHLHVHIPANPEYSSLNLAAAVQILAYECRMVVSNEENISKSWDYRLANADEMDKFFTHLRAVLIQISFLKENAPRKLMTRLRRLFLRTRLDVMEINILRGILASISETITTAKQKK